MLRSTQKLSTRGQSESRLPFNGHGQDGKFLAPIVDYNLNALQGWVVVADVQGLDWQTRPVLVVKVWLGKIEIQQVNLFLESVHINDAIVKSKHQ